MMIGALLFLGSLLILVFVMIDDEWKRRGFPSKAAFDECVSLGFASRGDTSDDYILQGFSRREDYAAFLITLHKHQKELYDGYKRLGFNNPDDYLEFNRLGFINRDQYEEFRVLGFTSKAQYDEFKALDFSDTHQYYEYKALGFTDRDQYLATRPKHCLICSEDITNLHESISCASGHGICLECGVGLLESAIGDHASLIHCEGIRYV